MHFRLGHPHICLGNRLFRELPEGPADNPFSFFGARLFGWQAGNRKDDPPVTLYRRTDQAIARLLRVAGFQPIRANPQLQQGVAVEPVVGRTPFIAEFSLGKDRVIVGKLHDQPLGKNAKIPHRHPVIGIGPARCIGKGRCRHPKRRRPFGHQRGKGRFRTSQTLGHNDAGIIARIDDHAVDQFFNRRSIIMLQHHGRSAVARHLHGIVRNSEGRVHRDPPIAQGLEQHVDRHQLGHRSRGQRLIGVLVHQHSVGRHVIDPCCRGRRLESPRGRREDRRCKNDQGQAHKLAQMSKHEGPSVTSGNRRRQTRRP